MPPTLTYPGVYIEELPSGVHTITGVATSIAAFVGWAPQGSVTKAVMVESWSDFAREFGGLSSGSYLGYAVNQFFANGGQQAYIVRLVANATDTPTATIFAATAKGIVSTLTLFATSPGQWGNNLLITVMPSTLDPTRFSVQVQLVSGAQKITVENFANLSVSPTDPQYVVNVIDNESDYITFLDPTISLPPPPPPPALPGATASANLGTSTVGRDGDVLVPVAPGGNFELALLPLTGQGGIYLLDNVDIFNLLCVPAETDEATVKALQELAARPASERSDRRRVRSHGRTWKPPGRSGLRPDQDFSIFDCRSHQLCWWWAAWESRMLLRWTNITQCSASDPSGDMRYMWRGRQSLSYSSQQA